MSDDKRKYDPVTAKDIISRAVSNERFTKELDASKQAIADAREKTGTYDTEQLLREAVANRPQVALLLEDDEPIIELLEEWARRFGITLLVARTFVEAEEVLADTSNTVAFAIVDHGELDGAALLAADLVKSKIPSVCFTGGGVEPADVHGMPVIHKTEPAALISWMREQAQRIK